MPPSMDCSDSTSTRNLFFGIISSGLRSAANQINYGASCIQNGIDSIAAVQVVASCRSRGLPVTFPMLMSSESIQDIAQSLDDKCRPFESYPSWVDDERSCSTDGAKIQATAQSQQIDTAAHSLATEHVQATDTQLSFIHGSNTSPGRNIIQYCETYETRYIGGVKRAWNIIVSTEPIFRTQFEIIQEHYCMVEGGTAPFIWEEETYYDRELYTSSQAQHGCREVLKGVKFRVVHLVETDGPKESTVIWIIHHALIDSYSSTLLLNKHRSLLRGGPIKPSPSYTHFVRQLSNLQSFWRASGRDFWERQERELLNAKHSLQLAPSTMPTNHNYQCQTWEPQISQADLSSLAKHAGVTAASIFYAAWALTLAKYVDSGQVSFGLILSGRSLPLPHATDVIGPLINTVPFQIVLDPTQNVTGYLSSVFRHYLELDKWQWAMPSDKASRSFSTTLSVQFEMPVLETSPPGLVGNPQTYHESSIPLLVEVLVGGSFRILYHDHEISPFNAQQLGNSFSKAIKLLTNRALTIGECWEGLVTDYATVLQRNGNCFIPQTSHGFWNESLIHLFEETCENYHDCIAIERGAQQISFSELNRMSTSVARFLALHVQPGEVICVHADRSINWVVAIYGVLRAGGVYCALDAALPGHLKAQNFHHSGSSVFLCGNAADKAQKPELSGSCFSVQDILLGEPEVNATGYIKRQVDSDAGAYLCFTSGSTGAPKAILCSHRNLVAFQKDFDVRLRAKPNWRIGQVMSPAFDGSIHEIFSALSYGSTLVLRDSNDPFAHLNTVDAVVLTPSIAKILDPSSLSRLKVLYLVGEAVPQAVCDMWAARVTTFNMYGPAEATCGATIKLLEHGKPVTLGRPNPSTRIYILDSRQTLVIPGVIGEICLAGVQVSLGYLNNPQENATRFLHDPLLPCGKMPERIYRTGDRGYWDENGELHFCGRNDRQVKLRGFRIDMDDVEARILSCVPGCTAVVVTQNRGDLIAILQPKDLDIANTRRLLSLNLPRYAVPQHVSAVDGFPRSNAGKIDYKSMHQLVIPKPTPSTDGYNSRLLGIVTQVWKDVLGPERTPTVDSDFFELGGHSLLQIQVANKISRVLGYSFPLMSVIKSQTLGDMVKKLEQTSISTGSTTRQPYDITRVSPIEESWHDKYHFHGGSSSFNIVACFELGADIDHNKLMSAWNTVLGRHAVLRSRYHAGSEGSPEKTFAAEPPEVETINHLDVQSEVNKPFDLARECLIRVIFAPGMLLLISSHIILDYTALNTILREVGCRYSCSGKGGRAPTSTEADSIESCCQTSTGAKDFWKSYLADIPKPDYSFGPLGGRCSYSGRSRVCKISPGLFHGIRRFTVSRRLTPHQIALSAVALAIQHHTDGVDLALGAPHLGREGAEAQAVVGLFLQPLVVRIRIPPSAPLEANFDFLRAVQDSSQKALAHALPHNSVLEALEVSETLPDTPLFDVMVSYHEGFGGMTIPGVNVEPCYLWTEGAKFKLMVEFVVASEETLLMRLEYSDECIDERTSSLVEKLILHALELIVEGSTYRDIKHKLTKIREADVGVSRFDAEEFYGRRLNLL